MDMMTIDHGLMSYTSRYTAQSPRKETTPVGMWGRRGRGGNVQQRKIEFPKVLIRGNFQVCIGSESHLQLIFVSDPQ